MSYEHRIIAGGQPGDFATIQHVRLCGSNLQIGRQLAEMAWRQHQLQKIPWTDPLKTRVQRRYMRQHYPIHYERMLGAAQAYGANLEDDTLDFSFLNYISGLPGCSSVAYPPGETADGHAVLSRNFDFSTGGFGGMPLQPEMQPAAAQAYLMEVYPDEGHASLYMACFDLFGCTDGINSAGLAVTLNADAYSGRDFPMTPTFVNGVGLNEIQVMRFLLDTCATAEEAKEALLLNKHYYMYAPCHYLITDRAGSSFIWEYGPAHNGEYILPGAGQPQVMCNHLAHQHPNPDELPEEDFAAGSFARQRALQASLQQASRPLSKAAMRAINASVFITDEGYPQPVPSPDRTLWHALYDCEEGSLEISFYLRDALGADGGRTPQRSPYLKFQLEH